MAVITDEAEESAPMTCGQEHRAVRAPMGAGISVDLAPLGRLLGAALARCPSCIAIHSEIIAADHPALVGTLLAVACTLHDQFLAPEPGQATRFGAIVDEDGQRPQLTHTAH